MKLGVDGRRIAAAGTSPESLSDCALCASEGAELAVDARGLLASTWASGVGVSPEDVRKQAISVAARWKWDRLANRRRGDGQRWAAALMLPV